MIPVEEALGIVLAHTPRLESETVGLSDAGGRVLREAVRADRDLPPFNRVLVDGYAVQAASLAGGAGSNSGRLRVVERIAAGAVPRLAVGPGEASAVMTGAPLPEGADAAVMVEHTSEESGFVRWPKPGTEPPPLAPGTAVTPRGAEVRAGTVLLEAGSCLSAAGVGVLATVGAVRVSVGRLPRTAVLSTGDELTHPRTAVPRPAQIRDANSHLIAAQLRALGLPVRRLGFVRDQPERIAEKIAEGLEADVLFLSGGVSMGRFDFVEQVLEEQGVRLLVTAVAIRPGKPFVFGVAERPGRKHPTLVFGLPGNPVSAFTTLEVFARPALDRLQGLSDSARPTVAVRLAAEIRNAGPRLAYLPARVAVVQEELEVTPIRSQGSADVAALALANALVIVPGNAGTVRAGESLLAQPLAGFPDPSGGWHDPRQRDQP